VLVWWRALSEVDQAHPGNVSRLVTQCEVLFNSERSGWLATSAIAHANQAKTGTGEPGGGEPVDVQVGGGGVGGGMSPFIS
jgi:hypothetical protein